MKIKSIIFVVFIAIQSAGCEKVSNGFEMTVDKVEVLEGFILKGIAISGAIKNGCISTGDAIFINRDGTRVLDTTARILDVKKESETEAVEGVAGTGDRVAFYLPDMSEQDVKMGDIVVSDTASCERTPFGK